MLTKTKLLLTIMVFVQLMVSSCREDADILGESVSAEEEVEIFSNSSAVTSYIDEDLELSYFVQTNPGANGRSQLKLPACATLSRDTLSKTITIDFGEACVGPFDRTRSGKLIITYGGDFNDMEANRVITFNEYFVNNRQISGEVALRNLNLNENGHITATRSLKNLTVTFPDDNTLTINGSTTRELIEGSLDGDISNNVIKVTGSYEGISTRGRKFSHEIVAPVISSFSCRASGGFLRVSGIIQMTIEGIRKDRIRTIDYGDGTCDNEYTVTINEQNYNIAQAE